MLIERGGAGDGAVGFKKGSRRGSPGIHGEANKEVQSMVREEVDGGRARQAGRAIARQRAP